MSSQIAAKVPRSCGIRAGRARNHQCRCSLPSPQRQTCTRPIPSSERTARSIRASRTPSSAASSSGTSPGSAKCSRGSRIATNGSPLGRSNARIRQRSLVQKNLSSEAEQASQSIPPSPLLGASRSTGGASGRGRISPSKGNVTHPSTGGIRSALAARACSCSGVSGTVGGDANVVHGGMAPVLLRARPGRGVSDVLRGAAGGDALRGAHLRR
jgi:hypothetical protein